LNNTTHQNIKTTCKTNDQRSDPTSQHEHKLIILSQMKVKIQNAKLHNPGKIETDAGWSQTMAEEAIHLKNFCKALLFAQP